MNCIGVHLHELETRLADWERAVEALRAREAELPPTARSGLLQDLSAYHEARTVALARLTAHLRVAESGTTSISGLEVDAAWRELAKVVEGLLARYR